MRSHIWEMICLICQCCMLLGYHVRLLTLSMLLLMKCRYCVQLVEESQQYEKSATSCSLRLVRASNNESMYFGRRFGN